MKVSIHTTLDESTELYKWLLKDPAVAGDITPGGKIKSGEMGLALDVLNLAIPNTIALASLVTSILTYRQYREESGSSVPSVQIEHSQMIALVDGDLDTVLGKLLPRPSGDESGAPS
jgi:hypothetical protein